MKWNDLRQRQDLERDFGPDGKLRNMKLTLGSP
jgi:hypothetical protein